MSLIAFFGRKTPRMGKTHHLRKKDTPLHIALILTGTAAVLLVNFGQVSASTATGVVLNNFSLVATGTSCIFYFQGKGIQMALIAIAFTTH